ncbi:hypothetical protein [Mesonia sp. K7]|uniref:hypothetical protein n=1 Tax=Mesonia sp. K7 TaxID=2218606 RepID=UPI000DA78595|nr:hypothetical protein [Mesonia sp. K7]PZD79532.1 hypothetical protein DNG35_00555 [Mesonia sp. K7]
MYTNKVIPKIIAPEVEKALSFYPELKEVPITFKFKDKIKKSTMQAQPKYKSFFVSKENREYIILISRKFHIEHEEFKITDMDKEVLIGWIGHELGHVMDYKDRSAIGMLIFGLKYLFSSVHIKEVERAADTYAIQHGMYKYILATKNFILDNTHISPKYRARIKRLYMSPEEIMELVNELSTQETEEKVDEEYRKST